MDDVTITTYHKYLLNIILLALNSIIGIILKYNSNIIVFLKKQ